MNIKKYYIKNMRLTFNKILFILKVLINNTNDTNDN